MKLLVVLTVCAVLTTVHGHVLIKRQNYGNPYNGVNSYEAGNPGAPAANYTSASGRNPNINHANLGNTGYSQVNIGAGNNYATKHPAVNDSNLNNRYGHRNIGATRHIYTTKIPATRGNRFGNPSIPQHNHSAHGGNNGAIYPLLGTHANSGNSGTHHNAVHGRNYSDFASISNNGPYYSGGRGDEAGFHVQHGSNAGNGLIRDNHNVNPGHIYTNPTVEYVSFGGNGGYRGSRT